MQAIITAFHGHTDTKGSRISASADAGRIYVAWDDALGIEENHMAACSEYLHRMGWTGRWVAGTTYGKGVTWVCASKGALSVSGPKRPK